MSPAHGAPARRRARRVSIHFSVHDGERHRSLMVELVRRAREAGLAGATVFEGVEGYGASGGTHRQHLVGDDAPLSLVLIDETGRLDAFLHTNGELLKGVLVTTADVEIVEL